MNVTADDLLANRRTNAVLGWVLLVFLSFVAVESVVGGDLAWAVFVSAVVVLCLVPPLAFRDAETMLPWEVIAMAALPTLGRAIATFELTSDFNMYLSVAALALIVAVELDVFTAVKLTVGFAIVFVTLVTLATAGAWAVFRWSMDVLVGTEFLLEPGMDELVVHDELMMEFIYSAVSGLTAGIVFELYFRRRAPVEQRVPDEVTES